MNWKPDGEKQKPVRLNRTDGAIKPDRELSDKPQNTPAGAVKPDRERNNQPLTVLPDRPLCSLPRRGDVLAPNQSVSVGTVSTEERRWSSELKRINRTRNIGVLLEDLPIELKLAATAAEAKQPGTGVAAVLKHFANQSNRTDGMKSA